MCLTKMNEMVCSFNIVIINMSLVKYDYIINEYNSIIKTIIDKGYNISPFYIKTGDNNIIRTIDLIDEYCNLINVYLVIEFCNYKNDNVYYLITKLCVIVIQYTQIIIVMKILFVKIYFTNVKILNVMNV